jgi:hypothetical protein
MKDRHSGPGFRVDKPNTQPSLRRRLALLVAVPLLVYFASFVLLTYPLILRFRTHLYGDGWDGLLGAWGMWWVDYAVRVLHQSPWWTSHLYVPDGVSLVAHNLTPFNGLVGILLLRFLTLVEANNVMLVFGFVVGGLTAFWLAREVSGSYLGALAGGFAFTFSNYHFAHAQGHAMLVALEWVPLFALFWLRLTRAPSLRNALAAAGALGLVLLCDYYGLLCCILLGIVLLLYEAMARRDAWYFLRSPARVPVLGFVVAALLVCGPLLAPLLRTARGLTGAHPTGEFSLDLLGLFVPGGHWRYAWLTHAYWSRLPGNINESSVHVGLSSVAIALYVWSRRAGLPDVRRWFWALGVFAVLALGPVLRLGGHALGPPWLPYAWLAHLVPAFDLSGVPVRLVLVVPLCLAVIWAVGLASLTGTRGGRRWAAVLFALLCFELLPAPIPTTQTEVPAVYQALLRRPEPGALVDVATAIPEQMWLQTLHHRPMAFGYVSRVTPYLERQKHEITALVEGHKWEELHCDRGFRFVIHRDEAEPLVDLAAGRTCPEMRSIAFDQDAGLGGGWSEAEHAPSVASFRWSDATVADLRFILPEPAARHIRFRCWAFTYPGAPRQKMKLLLNGRALETVPIAPGPQEYTVEAPAAAWRVGANQVQLQFRYAESPAQRLPGNNDERRLSAAFDRFDVIDANP